MFESDFGKIILRK